MQESTGWKRRVWFVLGVVLLFISVLFWLMLTAIIAAEPRTTGWLILIGVVISAIPIGLGFYCLRRGTDSPTIEKISNAFIYILAIIPLAIISLLGSGRGNWFRAGVILLFISTLVWLFLMLVIVGKPEDPGTILTVGVILTAIPIGMGIYGVLRGRRQPVTQQISIRPVLCAGV